MIEQEVGAKNGFEWHSGFLPLMTFNGSALLGVLNDGRFVSFRECNERMPFCYAKKLMAKAENGEWEIATSLRSSQ